MSIGTLLTLLILVAPLIGSLIEKKLKSAGRIEDSKKVQEIFDALSGEERAEENLAEDVEEEEEEPGQELEPQPQQKEEVFSPVQVPEDLLQGGYKSVKEIMQERRKQRSETALPVREKEKIDKKKLVIYSEIMKPRYRS